MTEPGGMRAGRGRTADLSGRMAEQAVLRLYLRRGAQMLATRWRGQGAEIDLIVQDGPDLVFVEVKASRSHTEAALNLLPAQMRRITQAALEYCDRNGIGEVLMRFDVALVDATGRVELIPNAFGAV
ncbi:MULTISPECIES: YraN family protein [Paracoccus]|mgnify:CR=1 FL=1|uniref:YraN family protein n=2 Tax=Paracoccus TaxID=265 RepID=UPI000B3090E3|nr:MULTISPECIES: YraN family protein [Paracoccus]